MKYRNLTLINGQSILTASNLTASNSWKPAIGYSQIFFDCNILSCQTSANTGYESGGLFVIMYNSSFYNCYFDGLTALSSMIMHSSKLNQCEVTNFYSPRCIVNVSARKTIFHHNWNTCRGIGGPLQECIIHNCKFGNEALYRTTCYNCTFVNNTSTNYFWSGNGGTANSIQNCIFYKNTFPSNRFLIANYSHPTNSNIIRNNLTDVPGSRLCRLSSDSSVSSQFIIRDNICGITDAGIKDLSANDFHLLENSPAISSGLSSALILNTDFEGKFWKNPPSIGAYQYLSNVPNAPNKIYPM